MKRIQINAIAQFQSAYKEGTGVDFFDFALDVLNKALEGMSVKVASRDEYNVVIEVEDKDNPINTEKLYDFLMEQLGINSHEGAFLSIYNYNPSISFTSFGFGRSGLGSNLDKANNIRNQLNEVVIGQRHVIDILINGYIKTQTFVSETNTKPLQTYLFCGPASSGKTLICEEFARLTGMPAISFHAPDYLNQRTIGRLFSFVNKNPRGIVIFNEFEEFDGEFGPLIFNIFYTGKYNGVDFSNMIFFFTTTGGKKIYLDSGLTNFSNFTAEEIIRALKSDVNDNGNLRYNPYLLDILGKENVAMLNDLDYYSIHQVLAAHFKKHAENFTSKTAITVQADYAEIARFVLYSNPQESNLNVLKKRVESVLDEQVAYLAKNVDPNSKQSLLSVVKNIHIALPKKQKDEHVKRLFEIEHLDVLVVADKETSDYIKTLKVDNVNFVFARGKNDVLNKVKDGIDVIVLDPLYNIKGKTDVLDIEDVDSVGNDIFNTLVSYYHHLPLYLLSDHANNIPQSAYQTLLLKGAKDVIYLDKESPSNFVEVLGQAIVNWDICVDIKYLRKENLKLESNATQKLVQNKAGTLDAEVTLDNLALTRVLSSELDEDYILRNFNSFSDVIGNPIVKDVMSKYGRYLSNPHKYIQEGYAVPKGLLLYSRWHNLGKTCLVKALSKETGSNLVKFSCKKALMESASPDQVVVKLKEAFKKARRNAPAILHIDDINLVITPNDTPLSTNLISLLRNEIEYSLGDITHPILIVAEAYIDCPIPAILKDLGLRFLYLETPTVADRVEYIRRYFDKHHIEHVSDNVLNNFAARCYNKDYVELKNILDFAIHYAQGKELTDQLLTDSLDLYNQGDVSVRQYSKEVTLATSYHEMGHYLMHRLFGSKPTFVTIIARGDYGGYTLSEINDELKDYSKQYFLNDICVSFAGRAAEVIHGGGDKGINNGIGGDIKHATSIAIYMVTKAAMGENTLAFIDDEDITSKNPLIYDEVNRILKSQYERAIRLLQINEKNLSKLALALFEKKSLIGSECEEIVPDSDLILE